LAFPLSEIFTSALQQMIINNVSMEKPTSGIVSSIFLTAVYYDVNVVDVFPPTKSDVFVGR
jgi:hypothetical protein